MRRNTNKMNTMTYFYKPASGLQADVDRHRAKELDLRDCISKLEAVETKTEFDDRVLETYKYLLDRLLTSKGDVVNKIGRKNG
jgi:hypothetical protein